MGYDEGLAQRLREMTKGVSGLIEKKMFGGLSFLLQGNMAVGVIGKDLIVRVGPDHDAAALDQPFSRPFDFTGRKMKGWIMVAPNGTEEDGGLKSWIELGLEYAGSLPPK